MKLRRIKDLALLRMKRPAALLSMPEFRAGVSGFAPVHFYEHLADQARRSKYRRSLMKMAVISEGW